MVCVVNFKYRLILFKLCTDNLKGKQATYIVLSEHRYIVYISDVIEHSTCILVDMLIVQPQFTKTRVARPPFLLYYCEGLGCMYKKIKDFGNQIGLHVFKMADSYPICL